MARIFSSSTGNKIKRKNWLLLYGHLGALGTIRFQFKKAVICDEVPVIIPEGFEPISWKCRDLMIKI
jgi:hypothetical protein